MRAYQRTVLSVTICLLLGVIGVAVNATPVQAQESLSGTYTCVSVEIAGKDASLQGPVAGDELGRKLSDPRRAGYL